MIETVNLRVKLRLITDMLGTVPKNPKVYKEFIESKKPKEIDENESVNVIAMEEKGWTGYLTESDGRLFVYDYFVKGFLKNAAKVLAKEMNIKAFKQKVSDYVFVYPRKIYLTEVTEDKTPPELDVYERPLRAETPQGARVALARSDMLREGLEIEFQIKILKHGEIGPKQIEHMLEYGQFQGFGQFRNGGFGRFELVSVTPE